MTVSSPITKIQYSGNDSTTVFSFPYLFIANVDLAVVKTDSNGVDSTLILDTHYSVSGAGTPGGGSVTYPISGTPLATGEKLTIYRNVPYTQLTDMGNHGAYFLQSIEDALDRCLMAVQQLKEAVDRTPKLDVTDLSSPPSITDYNSALTTVQALQAAFDNLIVQINSAVATSGQTAFTMPAAWPDLDATSNVSVYDDGLKIDRDDYTVTAPDQVIFSVGRTVGHTIIFELNEALSSDALDQALRSHCGDNLLRNGSFESWSGGTSTVAPDFWISSGSGIYRDSDNVFGSYCAKISTGSALNLYQDYADYTSLQGKQVTLSCWVKTPTASLARLQLDDGIATAESAYHTGSGNWELLSVTLDVDEAATQLRVLLHCGGLGTAYYDGAKLERGEVVTVFSPHPNDEQIKGINYQNATPTNFTYGGLRIEVGRCDITGTGAVSATKAVTFGSAFDTVLAVFCTPLDDGNRIASALSLTTSGFTIDIRSPDGSGWSSTNTVMWLVIGVG